MIGNSEAVDLGIESKNILSMITDDTILALYVVRSMTCVFSYGNYRDLVLCFF